MKAECLSCGAEFVVVGREHSDGTKWIGGRCPNGHRYQTFDIYFLQPSNVFYPLVYTSFEDEYNKKRREKYLEKMQNRERISKELDDQFDESNGGVKVTRDPWVKRALQQELLND